MSTNIPTKNSVDSETLRHFNNQATSTKTVSNPANDFEVILQFFMENTGNQDAARNLTKDFIEQARINNFDPIELVHELKGLNGMQLNSTIAAIFNAGREKTSLLGFRQNRQVLNHVERTVIA